MTHWTRADLDRKWYLVPSDDGGLCHCNDNGKPACGADAAGLAESKYKQGYPVCEACWYGERDGGKMGLFATTPASPTAGQDERCGEIGNKLTSDTHQAPGRF